MTTYARTLVDLPLFATRQLRNDDLNLVRNSFLLAMRHSNHTFGIDEDFFDVFSAELDKMLARFRVLVAHPVSDDDEIAGWIAWHPANRVVGFVYTKKDTWHGFGIGTLLMGAAGFMPGATVGWIFASRQGLEWAEHRGYDPRRVGYVEAKRLLEGL